MLASLALVSDDEITVTQASRAPGRVPTERFTATPSEDRLPDETYAECRVIRTRDHTSMVLVTASTSEIERTVRLVAKKGY